MVQDSISSKQDSKSASDLYAVSPQNTLQDTTFRDPTNVYSVSQPPGNNMQDGIQGNPEEPTKPKGKSVLGHMVLTASYEDSVNIELPSWMNPVPVAFGSKAHGKLSADQWRTLCSINLIITLIRLWGNDTTTRQYQMLVNFIDLVTAVEVGSMLVTSDGHIQLYEEAITSYLQTLKVLYKEARIAPNHHLALHIPDFLRFFGPVHAWRAFALERYNYLLQNINTNQKFGVYFSSVVHVPV
jgi:hypothetical protein